MNSSKVKYVALDVHARHTVMGMMQEDGVYLGSEGFDTNEPELLKRLKQLPSACLLTLEEGPMAVWIKFLADRYVEKVLICNPKENYAISRNAKKQDKEDVRILCRLARLGELKEVRHPEQMHRIEFREAVSHYHDMTRGQVVEKQKIKAHYREHGVVVHDSKEVYQQAHWARFIEQLPHRTARMQAMMFYEILTCKLRQQERAYQQVVELSRKYPEIEEFQKIPGVGPIVAATVDAIVFCPERFADKRRLHQYCQLGITDKSSDGKSLGFKRLNRNGNPLLKYMSYAAWRASLHVGKNQPPNEVCCFYRRVLKETNKRAAARLTTQRKILTTMWAIWKNQTPYDPRCFAEPHFVVINRNQPPDNLSKER